jgi:cob(I)alamin adenosyltransferase
LAGIYTRRGDGGSTSLGDGARVPKSDDRIEVLGTLDEANCLIGLARVNVVESDLDRVLEFLQQRLFNCAAVLASVEPRAGTPTVTTDDVAALEAAIDRYSARTGPLNGFTLPGGDETAARLHVARTGLRRAERALVRLGQHAVIPAEVASFINRGSDLLFAAALLVGDGSLTMWRADSERP